MSNIPTATYRLQFHQGFTFAHARAIVPYLARLGISHVYASPIFRAAPGSTHGYDVCVHNELNPELGSREEFEAFSAEMKTHGLGLIVDFVPNHMGIEKALNPWWRDVLENGSASSYAAFFDVDWLPVKRELENKVLLPVLGDQYGRVQEGDGFRVEFAEGDFRLAYGDFTLPLAPRTTLPFLRRAAELLASVPAELESIVMEKTCTRERLARLCELPGEWSCAARRWQTMNRNHRRDIEGESAPDANEEYLLYQTLLGAWPLEGLNDENRASFIARIQDYMVKALHEAKVNSSWVEPNAAWDEAVREFIAAIPAPGPRNRFPQRLALLAEWVAQLGAINSLTQTVLKLTCPGVPDFYQGSELWDFSLVDPDNRRPIDYELRRQRLGETMNAEPGELLGIWRDGRIKLFATHRLLALRREHPQLFAEGEYHPIAVEGAFADSVVAFTREHEGTAILVVISRHLAGGAFPPVGEVWTGTQTVPSERKRGWRDVFTGRICEGDQ